MTTAPGSITVPTTVPTSDDVVDYLTSYTRHYDRMIRRAYGDHGPDSFKRWREQEAAKAALRARTAQAVLRRAVGP